MPIAVSFDSNSRIWMITIEGEVAPEEVVEALRGMYESPDYAPDSPRLYDARESAASISARDMQRLATLQLSRESTRNARSAIVTSRQASYGVARMYQTHAEDMPIEVELFQSIDDARAWLLDGRRDADEGSDEH